MQTFAVIRNRPGAGKTARRDAGAQIPHPAGTHGAAAQKIGRRVALASTLRFP
jgi:hypothetical protein